MTMIIDSSYFKANLKIEGLNSYSGADATKRANTDAIGSYIEKYEREYLLKILGKNVWSRFLEYIQSGKKDNPTFDSLKDMLSTFGGEEGRSPIANYVFFYYVRRNQFSATMIGVTKTDTDNPLANPTPLLADVWNEMCEMNEYILSFLRKSPMWKDVLFDCYMAKRINLLGI